jgi:nucleolar protein 14
MNRLIPHLYELVQQSPLACGQHVLTIIKESQDEFTHYTEAHGGRGTFPTLDVLMYFKLVSVLFPTSDFHHPVVTPSMLYMSQILNQCQISTRRDVAAGLFLCSIFLEYVSYSKRFVPEVMNFLCGLMFMAMKKDSSIKVEPVIPPFKPVGHNTNFLLVNEKYDSRNVNIGPVKLSEVFSRSKASFLGTIGFRLGCIYQVIYLTLEFLKLYEQLPSYKNIVEPLSQFCKKLPTQNYPQEVQVCMYCCTIF